MSGNRFSIGKKGLFFILDLVLAVGVVVLVILYATTITPAKPLQQSNDLTYLEAQLFLSGQNTVPQYDTSKNFVCRSFTLFFLQTLQQQAPKICVNMFG